MTLGRDGQRPGRKLSRAALVGRRVAVRQSEGRVHTATVTTFAPGEGVWAGGGGGLYTLVWDEDGEEARRDLGSPALDWRLAEDEAGVDVPAPEFETAPGWELLAGSEALWRIALEAQEDAAAHKAQVRARALCTKPRLAHEPAPCAQTRARSADRRAAAERAARRAPRAQGVLTQLLLCYVPPTSAIPGAALLASAAAALSGRAGGGAAPERREAERAVARAVAALSEAARDAGLLEDSAVPPCFPHAPSSRTHSCFSKGKMSKASWKLETRTSVGSTVTPPHPTPGC